MRQYALGFMNMTPKEFDCITFYDLELKIKGHREAQKRQDALFREVAYNAFFAPYQDPKKLRNMTREGFWPIYGEKETKALIIDDAKKKRLADLIKKMNNG